MAKDMKEKVPIWRLFLLSASAGAVDLGYAVEGAYALPLMLASGVSLTLSTVLIAISPILGLLFQPFLGSASDQCTCSCGRRRPFIVLFSLTAVIGFACAPYSFYFDKLLDKQIVVIVGLVGCIFIFDFSIGALMLPTRAYLLDVVPLTQAQTGNFIISVSIGLNAALGYILGVIDWSSTVGETVNVVNQARFVFGMTAGLIFLAMLCTIFSVKEERPSALRTTQQETEPLIRYEHTRSSCFNFRPHSCCNIFIESIVGIAKFVYYMSFNMWLLWIMVVLALAADFAFVYSFTTFVGIAIYKGDPNSPEDSPSYLLFAQGVRMGSLGLAISTFCCSVMSLALDYISRWIRLKTILLLVLVGFISSLCLLMYVRELYQVLIVTTAYGPFLGVLLTVPYTLIPVYDEANMLFRKEWVDKPALVEGKAVATINTGIFLGQIIASVIIGPVVDAVHDVNYFMLIPAIFATLSFLVALPVSTPVLKK